MSGEIAKYEQAYYPASIIDNVDLQQVSATMQKIAQFQSVVQKTLRVDHDFGVIPGTGTKPTLLKPGAEKILMLMGLTSEYEIVEKVQDYTNGFFAFTVRCLLSKGPITVTQGLGHANTKEARYARRWVTEKKLPEGADKNSLQSREKDGKYGKYTEYLVENDDPYTLVNTVLKMAKKRAQVDAALTVASLSDIFTQDLEDFDLPPGNITPPPSRKSAPTPKNGGGITEPQKKKIFAMSKSLGFDADDMKALIKEQFGKDSSGDLTKIEASKLIEYLTTVEQAQNPSDDAQETGA